jgi:trehalose utilization protein
MIKVTIWNENMHERSNEEVQKIYPDGIHAAIAKGIANPDFELQTATLEQPEHGLSEERLNNTDVLLWWGHQGHHMVADAVVDRVYQRVLDGMGLIVLHSGHFSKIFKKLMGTSCDLKWRESDEKERIWVIDPSHPIAAGLGEYFELDREEMYGEHFDIPAPDELILVSWFEGGEVFRSGCAYHRGNGKLFYFRPGHESYPTFYDPNVLKVISNGIRWASQDRAVKPIYGNSRPLEEIKEK